MGQLGAAASVVQVIALVGALRARRLPPVGGLGRAAPGPLRVLVEGEATAGRVGLGVATGAPGLLGLVQVELP